MKEEQRKFTFVSFSFFLFFFCNDFILKNIIIMISKSVLREDTYLM